MHTGEVPDKILGFLCTCDILLDFSTFVVVKKMISAPLLYIRGCNDH